MKPRNFVRALPFLAALTFVACASSPTQVAPGTDAGGEVNRVSASIEEAGRKHYDFLAPKGFTSAVDNRNAAAEKLRKGKSASEVMENVNKAKEAIAEVRRVGDVNASNMSGVIQARTYAVDAQAPKFQEKAFASADDDLKSIGEDLEKGKTQVKADKLSGLEKRYGAAEIAARKHGEIGNVVLALKRAEDKGAKRKTPGLYQIAQAKFATAEHAIETSPHNAGGYATAVNEAKQAAQKLEEVLAIVLQNDDASEDVALTIWNQRKELSASRAALTQAETEAALKLRRTEEASASALADRNKRIATQNASIGALSSENAQYASQEELKQKIEEIKGTFAADEAEVMKDGSKIVVRLKKMQFASGRADLNPDSFATLQKVDTLIAAVPAKQITVEGHTDSVGSNKTNRQLSEKRAESVKKYLVSQGLPEELSVETEGFGSDRPLTTNKTKIGRATNRRVDIIIDTPETL